MSGHGHVIPNENGALARCGGPAICKECALEFSRESKNILQELTVLRAVAEAIEICEQRYENTPKILLDALAAWREVKEE